MTESDGGIWSPNIPYGTGQEELRSKIRKALTVLVGQHRVNLVCCDCLQWFCPLETRNYLELMWKSGRNVKADNCCCLFVLFFLVKYVSVVLLGS